MRLAEMQLLVLGHVQMVERRRGLRLRRARPVGPVAAEPPLARRLLVLLRHVLQRLRRRRHLPARTVPARPPITLRRVQTQIPPVHLSPVQIEVDQLRVLGYLRDEVFEGVVAVVLADEFREAGEGGVPLERGGALVQSVLVVGDFGLALRLALALEVERRGRARRRLRRRRVGSLHAVGERLHRHVGGDLLRLRVGGGGGELQLLHYFDGELGERLAAHPSARTASAVQLRRRLVVPASELLLLQQITKYRPWNLIHFKRYAIPFRKSQRFYKSQKL